ncbi:uncharacterized protein LOC112203799 [Rosa chinensis]|uniref:uncharacterized protein LOC112203799 n=1 Tax=Rosa chinensis TaxID=74649 RepID=UPI000D087635|nr:uncharacterized protein LOC112203799 [Rosa chinensis]
MTARLETKLSLREGEEPVDLGNLRVPGKEFLAHRFHLVGKLNTCRVVVLDSFRSVVRSMWRLTGTVEVQPQGDRFLFTFTHEREVARVKKGGPWGFQSAMILLNDYDGFSEIAEVKLDFVWIWVGLHDLPSGILTEPIVRLVGGTIKGVLEVDRLALRLGDALVRITLAINDSVRLDHRVRVSPTDVLTLQFQYERLLGQCRLCASLNHGGQRCPREDESESDTVVEEVVGMRHPGKEEDVDDDKRAKHSLALVPATLQPKNLGLEFSFEGLVEVNVTSPPKVYKKKGRPRGYRNKVKSAVSVCGGSGSMVSAEDGLGSVHGRLEGAAALLASRAD